MTYHQRTSWSGWIRQNFRRLRAGAKVRVPHWLPHPHHAGFKQLELAEDHGQIDDYAKSLSDGSRIHVHVHRDGTMVAHRDKYDPDHSPGRAVAHVLFETVAGVVILTVGGVAVVGGLIFLAAGGSRKRR